MKSKYLSFAPVAVAAVAVIALVRPGISAPPEPAQLKLYDSAQAMELIKAEPVNVSFASIAKAPKTTTLEDIVGTYMSRDISVYNPEREANSLIEIKKNSDGTATVSNLYRLGKDVIAEWDATTSTLKVKPQEVYVHDTYGSVTINTWSMSADGKRVVYNPSAPIVITPCEDGSISFSPWGVFVASGNQAGGTFEAYSRSSAYHPNGTMTLTPYGADAKEETYPVLLMEDTPGRVMVCNMLNNALGIMLDINPDGTGEITPQWVYNQDLYGDFYIYSGKVTGTGSKEKFTLDKEGTIKATQTESGIDFSTWGCVCLKSTTIFAKTAIKSHITTDFKLSAPSAGENTMTGKGTETEPYKIETLDQLQWIAKSINTTQSFKDTYFELANDIDAKSFAGCYYPIGGVNDLPFEGKFDGKGHSIKNLTQNFYGRRYAGIFGYLGKNGSVKNLNADNISYINSGKYIGGIVGFALSAVENCNVTGVIESTGTEIGGIIGQSQAPIKGCSFKGEIYGGMDMGGIVGYTSSSVDNCHVNAAINLTTYIPHGTSTHESGGIVGAAYGKASAKVTISNCYFAGSISDQMIVNQMGGICGGMWYGSITNCFNTGRLTCHAGAGTDGNAPLAGGICGYSGDVVIDNCYNAGAVNAPNSDCSGGIMGFTAGNSSSESAITNCYNSGMVNTNSQTSRCVIIGKVWDKIKTFTYNNNYYDIQTAGSEYPCDGGLSTSELISGNPINGLSSDIWVYENGYYPRLKGMSDNMEAYLSASAMKLSGEETIKKVRKPFTVSTANGIKWGFMNSDGEIVPSCDAMTVDGSNVTLAKGKYALESIIATTSDGTLKHYVIHIDPVAFEGEGTKENPFLIKNADDLYTLQQATDVYLQPHKGDYFLMTNDIDVSTNPAFKGIAADGSSSHYFGGSFDGGNHYIHNFKLHSASIAASGKLDSSSHDYAGLFGITLPEAEIKNVRIADDCEFKFYRYSGAIVGYSKGTIENCHNYAPITAYGQACGGIVGMVPDDTTSIKGCLNTGDVSVANGICGGIAGYSAGILKNCENIGNVTLTSLTGISQTNTTKNIGGIVGQNFGTIDCCVNGASVIGLTNVGGVVGQNSIHSTTLKGGNITNCLSYGIISGSKDATSIGAVTGDLASFNTISSNFYDAQLHPYGGANCVDPDGIKGLDTSEILTIKAEGITTGNNVYPSVSLFTHIKEVADVSSTIVSFDQLSHRCAVESEINLTFPGDASAILKNGKAMKLDSKKITLELGDNLSVADTLIITGNKYSRTIPLRAVATLFAGRGTSDDPHLITNISDWTKLANATNDSERDFRGHNFRITSDLKFSESNFISIANGSTPFNGTLDGNEHIISGYVLGSTTDKTVLIKGLVGHVGPAGKISNLKIKDANISAYQYAGALVGELCGAIENCSSEAEVTTGSGYAGGLVGVMKLGSSAKNCTNLGTVSTLAGSYTGGIASACYGSMINCKNEGTIITYASYGGGLAGSMGGYAINCTNTAEVMATKAASATYLGGLFGQSETGAQIIDCSNSGNLTGGKNYVGGIIGTGKGTTALLKENGVTIRGCKNTADLSSTGTYLGGIAGSIPASYVIDNCLNSGKLTGSADYMGGIIGAATNGNFLVNISNCRNEGSLINSTTGKKYIAGITGNASSNFVARNCINTGNIETKGYMVGGIGGSIGGLIYDCVNHGNITGNDYAIAGICGYGGPDSEIDGCVNAGNVTATGTTTKTYGTVGGILGYGYTRVNKCANFGTLSGTQNIGGIAGSGFSGISITGSYNAGKINYSKEDATNVGNIYAASNSMPGNYYDNQVNPSLPADAKVGAIGITKHELMDRKIDGFINNDASYPVPETLNTVAEARMAVVHYRLSEGSTPDNVMADFKIGTHDEIEWSVSDPNIATITGNDVSLSSASGKRLTLTATCGKLTKSFDFIINCTSGVSDLGTDMTTTDQVRYYTPDGQPATAETRGIVIIVTRNANGTTTTKKIMVR